MKGNKLLTLVAIVICAVVLIGEMYAYIPRDYGYSSEAGSDSEGIWYSVDDRGSDEFDAILMDNGDYVAVTHVYIYFDPSYASAVNEDAPVEVGAQRMTQEYYVDQLVKVLKYRGIPDVTILDARGLADVLASDYATGTCAGHGLAMASGAIPDTVFSGSADDLILKWIDAGGSLYWVGNAIGMFVSTSDGLKEVGAADLFVGTDAINASNDSAYQDCSDFRKLFSYEYNRTMYAPDMSGSDRVYLGAGYSDGRHSSTTFVQLGAGQVCVVGGEFNSKQVRDLAISICSGLCYQSVVLENQDGIVDGHYSGDMAVGDTHGNLRLYIYIGGYFCVYGHGYDFDATASGGLDRANILNTSFRWGR